LKPSQEQELLARREQLLARSDQLRRGLAEQIHAYRQPLAWAQRAEGGWQWLRAHPQWVVGGVAVLVVLRPWRAWRWGSGILGAWSVWQRVQPLWTALAERRR
jgi:hypothetical protein